MEWIRRIWNWCRRFRYRCGYGVHSPSDFYLITFVIYEKLPYYAFRTLQKERFAENLPHYRRKVNELLFRLVNHLAPKMLLEVGRGDGSSICYLRAARPSMHSVAMEGNNWERTLKQMESQLMEWRAVDFLHIAHTPYYKEVFEKAMPYVKEASCIVVGEPYETPEKQEWWKSVIQDERVRITFDLYDVGLMFFDPKRYKQNYIVNFL